MNNFGITEFDYIIMLLSLLTFILDVEYWNNRLFDVI